MGGEVWAFGLDRDLKVQHTVSPLAPQQGRKVWWNSTVTHPWVTSVSVSLAWNRLLEDLMPKRKMDFWALPKRRSSPTARPPCVRSYRKREGGQVSAWTSLLSFHWGSRTSGRKQTPTSLMLSKKTGKSGAMGTRCKFAGESCSPFLNYLIPHVFALRYEYITLFWNNLKLIEMLHE